MKLAGWLSVTALFVLAFALPGHADWTASNISWTKTTDTYSYPGGTWVDYDSSYSWVAYFGYVSQEELYTYVYSGSADQDYTVSAGYTWDGFGSSTASVDENDRVAVNIDATSPSSGGKTICHGESNTSNVDTYAIFKTATGPGADVPYNTGPYWGNTFTLDGSVSDTYTYVNELTTSATVNTTNSDDHGWANAMAYTKFSDPY